MPQPLFPDISVPYFEETPAKAGLAHAIATVIERTNLTQTAAAGLLGVSLPELRDLLRGNTRGFSVDQLIAFLLRLGCNVEITVRSPRGRLRHSELGVLAPYDDRSRSLSGGVSGAALALAHKSWYA